MQTILIFMLVFGILVVIHEFGHYIVAKKSGILVREFAIGFGPKLLSHRKNETTYTVRLLPVGGYVRMAGYEEESELRPGMPLSIVLNEQEEVIRINTSDKKSSLNSIPIELIAADLEKDLFIEGNINGDVTEKKRYAVSRHALIVEQDGTELQIAPLDRQFQSAPLLNRILTNFAGPFNNLLLAIVAFIVMAFLQGGVISNKPVIGEVLPDSPASQSGLTAGDEFLALNGTKVKSWMDAVLFIQEHPEESVKVEVQTQNGEKRDLTIVPKAVETETGETIGQMGIKARFDTSTSSKIGYGFTQSWFIIRQIAGSLASMFTGGFSIDMFGGPVAIFATTEAVAQTGFIGVINWLALLSLNLFILNLLPIPALDGGKILLNIIEGVRGKPLSEEKEGLITLIGVGMMVLLMIAVTWNDIQRFFIK